MREDACKFGGWGKEGAANVRVRVCLLTNGTSFGSDYLNKSHHL